MDGLDMVMDDATCANTWSWLQLAKIQKRWLVLAMKWVESGGKGSEGWGIHGAYRNVVCNLSTIEISNQKVMYHRKVLGFTYTLY